MENLVVTTFRNIIDATEGLDKLKELDRLCEITIYNILIVRKRSDNNYQLLHHEGVDMGVLPEESQLASFLYNTIDRPIGMATDIFSGLIKESGHKDEEKDPFCDLLMQFSKELQFGTFCIFLDVEEENISLIDGYMRHYHGVAIRTNVVELYHEYVEDKWFQTCEEMKQERNILEPGGEGEKSEVKARMEKLRVEREKLVVKLGVWIGKIRNQLNARIGILEGKINGAGNTVVGKLKLQKEKLEQKAKRMTEAMRSLTDDNKYLHNE